MASFRKLSKRDLMIEFDLLPEFENTDEISPYKGLVGQRRAVEAMCSGLMLEGLGVNIFVCGGSGTGKSTFVEAMVSEHAKQCQRKIYDWCYVYNFTDNDKPCAISLEMGKAEEFKTDMAELVLGLVEELPKFFSETVVGKMRSKIVSQQQKLVLQLMDGLSAECKEKGFVVRNSGEGFVFTPLIEGEEMTETQYNGLSDEEKTRINETVAELKLLALEVMRRSKQIKRQMVEELKELDERNATPLIGVRIDKLIEKYSENQQVREYLEQVRADLVDSIDMFIEEQSDEDEFAGFVKRYSVSVMCSSCGIPVVIEDYPDCGKLIGRIGYESKAGVIGTDFTLIQSGLLHRANGGWLILDAWQLLSSSGCWDLLKRSIRQKKICVEVGRSQLDILTMSMPTFKPMEIPLDVRVVLIGTPLVYDLLFGNDEEFASMFDIKVEFSDDIENTHATVLEFLGFVSNCCRDRNYPPASRNAVCELLRVALRRQENRLSFHSALSRTARLLDHASQFAKEQHSSVIEASHVKECIRRQQARHGIYRDKVMDMYRQGRYLICVNGYSIGEINALTVIDHQDILLGKQARITVAAFAGREGIINIEREVSMSGSIHSKGIMILSGYMGETFGQDQPLSFHASICFEQTYGELDGDSASAAELVALLSRLGDIPLNQGLAMTGSVNQKGEIQPVGGVNEKVEGYFRICNCIGLDGSQGVLIPSANVRDLVLDHEVLEAIDTGRFHLYAIEQLEDCFDILCEPEFRKLAKRQVYDLVKRRVSDKLRKYNGICGKV